MSGNRESLTVPTTGLLSESDVLHRYDLSGNISNITSNISLVIYETLHLHTTPEAYIVPIIFGLIFIIGVIGNGVLIYTVARNKCMRNTPNIYIVSLSLGDLLLILVTVPFAATLYTFTIWPYGVVLCKISKSLETVSLGVSVFTLTALSADRYKAIVDPMSKHMGAPLARTIATASLIWVGSILLAIPDMIGSNIVYMRFPLGNNMTQVLATCDSNPPEWGKLYAELRALVMFFVYFAIPMLVIAMFYLLMARILIISSHNMPGEGQCKGGKNKQIEARKKVAKVVLSFVLVFGLCWLPRHVYILWFHFDPGFYNIFWHVLKIFGFCLSFINSCVNPMALYFLSKQFRKYYNRYLFCKSTKKAKVQERENSNMYNFNSTVRRTSTTMTMIQSQTMC